MTLALKPLACIVLCLAILGPLSGCGEPEDDGQSANTVKTPLPPYPAWSVGMIGKPLASVVHGKADCIGVFDVVTARHANARSGVEVEGWAWDKTAKQGVQRLLIVDLDNRIVGAAEGGRSRTDVPAANPSITSPIVGWHGEAGTMTGTVLAVGLGAKGGQCPLSKSMKLDGGVY